MTNKLVLHPRHEMWRLMNLIWPRPFVVTAGPHIEVDYRHYVPGGKYEHFQYDDNSDLRVTDPEEISLEVTRNKHRYMYRVQLKRGQTEVFLDRNTLVPVEFESEVPKNLHCKKFDVFVENDSLQLIIGANSSPFLMAWGKVK